MTDALATWRRKRENLLNQQATATGPNERFAIEEALYEADRTIADLEADRALRPLGEPPLDPPPERAPRAVGNDEQAIDVSRVSQYASRFVGRHDELAVLDDAWAKAKAGAPSRTRLLTIVALGGEGKTSLVANWLAQRADEAWAGCDAAFAWSFFSQGTRTAASSSDQFLAEALTFFGDADTANSAQSAADKARKLARLVGAKRAILVLDGVEPLQYPPGPPHDGCLVDEGLSRLLRDLAASSAGLCLVTTRWSIPDTGAFRATSAPELGLPRLPATDARRLLREVFAVRGTDAELDGVVEKVSGHALALNLVGSYLRSAYGGDVRHAGEVTVRVADEADGHRKAHQVIAAYAAWLGDADAPERKRWWPRRRAAPAATALAPPAPDRAGEMLAVLRVAGLFDRPVASSVFEALIAAPAIAGVTDPLLGLDAASIGIVLSRLVDARLVTVERNESGRLVGFDAHPLVREFFASRLRVRNSRGWRAAHGRVYEHLCATTVEGPEPSFEALAPLYQAIVHGCHADRHQGARDDVYRDRICQRNRFYSTNTLGAVAADLGAVACFFTHPWDSVHPALTPPTRAWLLGEAGFSLHLLGRLTDAVGPLNASLNARVATGEWTNASASAQNVCELWLAEGDLTRASKFADDAVGYAEQADNPSRRMVSLACRGAVRFRLGEHADAVEAFTLADHWHHEREPGERWMYSLRGFQECEVAGAEVELAAWQHRHDDRTPALAAVAGRLIERATHTRAYVRRSGWLVDVGLDSVTITRARLWTAILTARTLDSGDADEAVTVLRQANNQAYLAVGLLARAQVRHHVGDLDGARGDLDEAAEIAGRGPMRLHLCDTLLLRAHLFHDHHPYPWHDPTTDLDEAQQLIHATSYHHRQPFLDHTRTLVSRHRT